MAKPSRPKLPTTLPGRIRVAEKLGVPLWVLMIPGLQRHKDLLTPGALKPLEAVVQNYLEASPAQRADIELIARAKRVVSKCAA